MNFRNFQSTEALSALIYGVLEFEFTNFLFVE